MTEIQQNQVRSLVLEYTGRRLALNAQDEILGMDSDSNWSGLAEFEEEICQTLMGFFTFTKDEKIAAALDAVDMEFEEAEDPAPPGIEAWLEANV